ncbi:hypothetical protein [Williamsia phyllosphaerae]|nr:hypothetical protein [Williamsia phyllosphaerae]
MAATTACTSGTTGDPAPNTAIASAQTSPAFPSESVPPGVKKDSVLDLNSTKDMTGVVTTVPFGESPYAAHLPDICTFVPREVMERLRVDNKRRGFTGTQLVSQACIMLRSAAGFVQANLTVNFYTSNISEVLASDVAVVLEKDIRISAEISGTSKKLPPSGPEDSTFEEECGTAWGTFFGAIVVNYRTRNPDEDDPCAGSINAAKIIAPAMPKSPSQMRPAQ